MDKYQILNFLMQFVVVLGNLLTYAIIGRVLISWFSMGQFGQRGKFSQIIFDVTDPVINLAKKLPHKISMIDLSPIIALLGIDLIVYGLQKLIINFA
jgi:uncharacterized protein YggT (Ycf19 family)